MFLFGRKKPTKSLRINLNMDESGFEFCISCGAHARPGARFCPSCAQPLRTRSAVEPPPIRADEHPYLFISYSHKDYTHVMPILNMLASRHYRFWFDQNLQSGRHWDDELGKHIEKCSVFISMVTQNYLASSNCLDELHMARDLGKNCLLIYLEPVELPSGIRLRHSRRQAIHRFKLSTEEFYCKLAQADGMSICK